MGSFLDGLGTLFGGAGNAGAASSNAWNYGQYSPFTVNNPMGTTSWNGTSGTSTLSPLQSQLQGAFGNSILGGLGQQYTPYNMSGLQGTYNNLFGNGFQNGVNNNFQQTVSGIMPFLQQANQSNLDNEFSKGTLASTAGSYQTAGQQMGTGATLSNLYNQAYQNQLASAGQQWNAAMGQAGLGEQQAEFAPQQGLARAQAGIGGLNTQNSAILNQMQLAGNLGAQRSGANVAAATPGIGTGEVQDQATAGLLSGLLFGGGTGGGLLSALLGNNGSSSGGLAGLLGKGISGLGGLFSGNQSSAGGGQFGGVGNSVDQNPGLWSGLGGYDWNNFSDTPTMHTPETGGNYDLTGEGASSNWWDGTGFSGAGGQAATTPQVYDKVMGSGNFGNALNTVGGALGAYQGLASGTATGEAQGALSAAQLAARNNLFGGSSKALGNYAGGASNALGIYTGLKQGGVAGYSNAAVNAAQLGARTGAFGGASGAIGSAAGYAAIPLALYNEINSWQSGATGQDALGGAATGAAIGSVVPGIGTAIGALIGGAAGALSSVFGNGKVDPENKSFEGFTQAYNKAPPDQRAQLAASDPNPYVSLAGMFDLRSNQIKGQIPIYNKYGRMGEEKFTNDLIGQVNQAKAANPQESANEIFVKQVQPWIDSMGQWKDSNKDAMEALLLNMTNQIYTGSYKNNFKAIGGDSPFKNK